MKESTVQDVRFYRWPDESKLDQPAVWVADLGCGAGETEEMRRAFVLSVIARYLDVAPDDVRLHSDAHGRLALAHEQAGGHNIDFNLAHCRNICVLGICCRGRIGVDVEILGPGAKLATIGDYLSIAERARISRLPPDDRPQALYRCWTAKEAFVKAVGHGLSFGLDQVETEECADGSLCLARVRGSRQLARGWMLVHRVDELGDAEAIIAVVLGR